MPDRPDQTQTRPGPRAQGDHIREPHVHPSMRLLLPCRAVRRRRRRRRIISGADSNIFRFDQLLDMLMVMAMISGKALVRSRSFWLVGLCPDPDPDPRMALYGRTTPSYILTCQLLYTYQGYENKRTRSTPETLPEPDKKTWPLLTSLARNIGITVATGMGHCHCHCRHTTDFNLCAVSHVKAVYR